MPSLCRDCFCVFDSGPRCPTCRSPRLRAHDELFTLSIAHMDCDAFYASVEKRDDPSLRDKPVIVGGGTRGVVSTCCYIARISGVRSAMPMFEARRRCPEAVVIKPRMRVYAEVSRAIRAKMEALTPAIQPLSLDEAFLDLSGTERLHGAPPAVLLARLAAEIEAEIGITISIGLSHNKFLAKIASDLDKPRGFSVIGRAETESFLAAQPLRVIWGVGLATQTALEAAGIRRVADLQAWEQADLAARFGTMGARLWELARGIDSRRVEAHEPMKSLSTETTFAEDTGEAARLDGYLWGLCEELSTRAKAKGLAGRTVVLKLKEKDFRLITRRRALSHPTQLAETLYRMGRALLDEVPPGRSYRLMGIGLSDLSPAPLASEEGDLLDPGAAKREAAERARDAIRARFGEGAIIKGRSLRRP